MVTTLVKAIIIMALLLLIFVGITDKGMALFKGFSTGAEISAYCNSWAAKGCLVDEDMKNLQKAVEGENICESTDCSKENKKGCKCGNIEITDKPFCCIQNGVGTVYPKQSDCNCPPSATGSGSNSGTLERLKYKCWNSVSSDKDPLRIALKDYCGYHG